MISEKKLAANRANGRKGRGPKTTHGKALSSRNALRHGLAAIGRQNPLHTTTITQIAKLICDNATEPELLELATIIAENEYILRCARAERVAAIERLRDRSSVARSRSQTFRLSLKRRRFRPVKLANGQFAVKSDILTIRIGRLAFLLIGGFEGGRINTIDEAQMAAFVTGGERDELSAACAAVPDLLRLQRYERRAWSRRKRAIRQFVAIKGGHSTSGIVDPQGVGRPRRTFPPPLSPNLLKHEGCRAVCGHERNPQVKPHGSGCGDRYQPISVGGFCSPRNRCRWPIEICSRPRRSAAFASDKLSATRL